MNTGRVKTYADLYLYQKGNYEKQWMQFLVQSEILKKDTKAYEEMEFTIAKMGGEVLLKTLRSDNVVLIYDDAGLPRSLKVFAAKDIKRGDKKLRVFIDVSNVIKKEKNGHMSFDMRTSDAFIAHLTAALVNLIYYADPNRLLLNVGIVNNSCECFARLFTHVIDYLRIGGVDKIREKTLYLSALYYNLCVLALPMSDRIENFAMRLSGLSVRDIEILSVQLKNNTFDNISTFIESLSEILKANELKIDNFVEKWLFLYHSGTQFALELFPAFSTMITNAYNGAYLNNQKLIEKICAKPMVDYYKQLIRIGGELK